MSLRKLPLMKSSSSEASSLPTSDNMQGGIEIGKDGCSEGFDNPTFVHDGGQVIKLQFITFFYYYS